MTDSGNAAAGKGCCIVGFANSKTQTPWDRPNTDFVLLNELHRWFTEVQKERREKGLSVPDYRAWFELHTDEDIGPQGKPDRPDVDQHWAWLSSQPVNPEKPIYMQKVHPRVPNSVEFPLLPLYERFKARVPALQHRNVYLTSSIGMMLMWAIAQGRDANFMPDGSTEPYTWIGLYGIDLAGDTEYEFQRPNAEFAVGWAAGLGIAIEAPNESAILKGECIYGYEKPPELAGPLNRAHLQAEIDKLTGEMKKKEAERDQAQAIVNTLHGAIQAQQANLRFLQVHSKRGITRDNLMAGSRVVAAP